MGKLPTVYVVGYNPGITRMFYQKHFEIITDPTKADITCFIGGADIAPELYGHKAGPHKISTYLADDLRDKKAWEISTQINKNSDQLRVGICRGGQFLNAMNGGTMYQHVNNHSSGHDVIDTIFKNQPFISVTSTHHQMMNPTDKAEILAYSEGIASEYWDQDGKLEKGPEIEPEVVWYEDTRSLCFQPHPEYPNSRPKSGLQHQCHDYFFDLIQLLR